MDQNGNYLWGENGCSLGTAPTEWSQYKLAGYANGTYSVFYANYLFEQISGLYRRDLSAEGTFLNPEPLTMVESDLLITNLNLFTDQNTGMLSWNAVGYYDRGESIVLNSLWTCRVNAYPVSIEDPLIPAMIGSVSNYPNPFRNQTTIRFDIKAATPVKVDIYNLRGQHVRSLLDDSKAPGSYDLAWDTKDDNGRAVANGVYLYKIRTGTYSSSKKMILLK